MWWFYIFALIPVIVGLILFLFDKEIAFREFLIGTIAAFIIALTFNIIAFMGATSDIETWSGKITKATHYPRWVEEYQQIHTRTVGSGKNARTETYYTTEHRTHPEYWEAETSLDYEKKIKEKFFNEISKNFGNLTTEDPHKSGFDSGDRNIYVAYNKTGYIYPVTDLRRFENRIKASPSTFSFPKIPTNINPMLYEWPENPNWLASDRLIGEGRIDAREFDIMNSRMGFRRKVNIIMINFGLKEQKIAQWQQAKWIGGKKNDLVICYGGNNDGKAEWAYVFGWSDSELCKKKIQTILVENKINTDILKLIEEEIIKGYVKKDWHSFDYITVEPSGKMYVWYFIMLFISQGACWAIFHFNNLSKRPDKYTKNNPPNYRRISFVPSAIRNRKFSRHLFK